MSIDWSNIFTEVLALVFGTLILACGSGFALWLRKAYNRLVSIDNATQELHVIAKIVDDHELRIDSLENWKLQHPVNTSRPIS